MHSDSSGENNIPDLVAEMQAIVDETRRAIAASQVILDRCVEHGSRPPAPEAAQPEIRDTSEAVLDEIGEGLIHAYRFAKHDGDILTLALIEKALFHVGRRLAHGLSAAEAGLVCH